jgi:hypothetical protein
VTFAGEVRSARPDDVERLVELRQENGRAHVALEPDLYRVPDAAVVREHFAAVMRRGFDLGAILVAEDADGYRQQGLTALRRIR